MLVVEAVAMAIFPVALMFPVTVSAPEAKVPVVVRFSSAKLIAPVSELMLAAFNIDAPPAVLEAVPNPMTPVNVEAPVTPRVPPTVVLPLVSSTLNLSVSIIIPFKVDVAVTDKVLLKVVAPVKVEAPVTSKVPPVLILVPIVVAATIPAVASVATMEATITWRNNCDLISFFIVF